MFDPVYLAERIAATKTQIAAYEAAIDALTVGGISSYTFNSGQTQQTVTKLNLQSLQTALTGLYNRLATLEARLNGSGASIVGPAY